MTGISNYSDQGVDALQTVDIEKIPSDPNNAIEVYNVWKSYRTGAIRGKTLLHDIESFFAGIMGREDPNSKILKREEISLSATSQNKRFWAVKGVSFTVAKGEVVAILGRNGAGKSTLLQVLCQITEADRGIVRINGKIASLLGAGVGFNDEMTGRENVFLNGSILGMSPSEVEGHMESIADFAEIPEFLDTPVKRYSSGMKSRLGFSVAVHLNSDVMILDEVFATGDRIFRMKCIERMKALAGEGRTILIVTHMPTLLKGVCERGIVLRDGVNYFDGDIETAVDLYLEKMDLENPSEDDAEKYVKWEQLRFLDHQNEETIFLKKNESRSLNFSFCVLESFQTPQVVVILRAARIGVLARFSNNFGNLPAVEAGELKKLQVDFEGMPLASEVKRVQCCIRLFGTINGERMMLSERVLALENAAEEGISGAGILECEHRWKID